MEHRRRLRRLKGRPSTWWLAWSWCAVVLALLPPIVALTIASRHAPDVWVIADPWTAVIGVVYGGFGALLAARRPGNALGWLFLAMGLVGQLAALLSHWAVFALVARPSAPGGAAALWLGLALSSTLLVPIFPLLLFPSGRLADWPTRVVAALAAVFTIALPLLLITGDIAPPGFPALYDRTPNPLALDAPLGDPGIAVMALLLCGLAAVGLLLARFRAARGATRQQYKWVVLAMTLVIVATLADFLARAGGTEWYRVTSPALSAAMAFVPVAMTIAILRHRLWDIDVIISRALVYLALSASAAGIYVFVVAWLGAAFRARGNLLLALVATGVVAVLFQPLRERIQRGINRLLFGERDEPYAVISRLGRRLEESLAPEAMLPAIAATVREALKLPYSAIALPQGGEPVVVAAVGQPPLEPVRLPLVYQHAPVGELLLAPRGPGEAFSAADRRLLDDLARQAGIAVHAVQLTHELQRARERLVEAREEERRRLRRDLHDGLGSQLAALNLQAGALRGLIARDPAAAQAEVGELRAELRAAIASIRVIVHGLRPPALDELGLALALRERARQYAADGLAVEADLPATLPPLPAAVEVAVYRIAEEALANVARHAEARRCAIRIALGAALTLTVEDDGVGVGADAGGGLGLLSMRERAEEVGGSFSVGPRPGGGTCVTARLPLGQERADA